MKTLTMAVTAVLCLVFPACAQKESGTPPIQDIRAVSPALERYTKNAVPGEPWKRPGLSPRGRSIVTLAVLIARSQTMEMRYHFDLALGHGVKAGEISEIITHLAFYSGWANATSAVAIAAKTFDKRGIVASADESPEDDARFGGVDGAGSPCVRRQITFDLPNPGGMHHTAARLAISAPRSWRGGNSWRNRESK